MEPQEYVVTTQAGSGDVTPAPDRPAILQKVSITAGAAGVAERAEPDDSPAAPGSDEIDVEEIFNFDIDEIDPEDDTDDLAFRRSRNRLICSASSDGQTSFHRFGTVGLVLTARETRDVYDFLAETARVWGEKCR